MRRLDGIIERCLAAHAREHPRAGMAPQPQ
jgi:hypothetical protein